MPTYSRTAAKSAQGVAYVAGVAAQAGCILHRVDQENDLGIDGFLELVRDGRPINELLALQIKTGESYWKDNGECHFAIGEHRGYWERHPLPMFGIVVDGSGKDGAWVSIKPILKREPDAKSITFRRTKVNRFDGDSLRRIMIPLFDKETADLKIAEALQFLDSSEPDEVSVGIDTLFRRFSNLPETWDAFCHFLRKSPAVRIPPKFAYYLAHIPWHGDLFGYGILPDEKTREFAKQLMAKFDPEDLRKLISMIDENGITRGAIGQSVEAVVNSISSSQTVLVEIINDPSLTIKEKELAAELLAIQSPSVAKLNLPTLITQGSDFSQQLLEFLSDEGSYNPYG